MKIAQVAPLFESVPPQLYGGTERIVSFLTEELVRQGHDVTLYASGDSVTSARLVPVCPRALRLAGGKPEPGPPQTVQLERLFADAPGYDVVHFHNDFHHLPLSTRQRLPFVHTLHNRSDTPELADLFRLFPRAPLISISNAQRQALPGLNWQATVYHGLPLELFHYQASPQPYVAFLGRISPEKQVHHAVQIARKAGIPLKIAAKVDAADRSYYENVARPLLALPGVEFVGEIGGADKDRFLGDALALLFPISWPEPFGLVMIEALACGTPVIAYRQGSVPEVIVDGVSGYIVDGVSEAVAALRRIEHLQREHCRSQFEQRFSAVRMTSDYVSAFEFVADSTTCPPLRYERHAR